MTTEDLSNPHDKFFRETFGRKEVAEGFIAEFLPEIVRRQLDVTTLEIVKDSYVDKELSEHFSDMLYKICISGKPAFIYLLLEHKSYVDKQISFQLLRNMVKIWEQHFKQNKKAKKLPIIIPLVIYHGKAAWKVKEGFTPLFDTIEGVEQYIPDFRYELFDISHIPEDNIKGNLLYRAVTLLLRSAFDPEQLKTLPKIFDLLNRLSNASKATEYIELFIRYLVSTVESEKTEDLTQVITKSLKYGGRVMPTIAEKWLQEGIERGIEKGIGQGIERGIGQGIEQRDSEIVTKMVENGISATDIRKITGLSSDKIDQIRKKLKKK